MLVVGVRGLVVTDAVMDVPILDIKELVVVVAAAAEEEDIIDVVTGVTDVATDPSKISKQIHYIATYTSDVSS